MEFIREFNWDHTDFIVMGILIFGTSFVLVKAMQKIKNSNKRILAGVAIAMTFIYIWAELAVGIFTNLGS